MRRTAFAVQVCICSGTLLRAKSAHASAPPPIVASGFSPNGLYLVAAETDLAPAADPAGGRQIRSTTFSIQARGLPPRLAAYPHWLTETCHITVSGKEPGSATFWWPLVNNAGDTLVLIAPLAPHPATPALRLYHCPPTQSSGTFVREVPLSDLWTPTQLNPSGSLIIVDKGDKPPWFSGGSLAFTPDGKSLVYRSQWHSRCLIHLATGAVHCAR